MMLVQVIRVVISLKLLGKGFFSLLKQKKYLKFILNRYSECSKTKCIGITIETRPDYCLKTHLR